MSSPQPAADLAVVAAYQQQTEALRAKIAAYITAVWASLGVYRAAQQAAFVKQVTPVIAAAQRQMSALTVGYHAAQRNVLIGRSLTIRVDPATVSGAASRGGVDPTEVYARPFNLVWRQLNDLPRVDGSIEKAIASGLERAIQTAHTDVQLAKVQTSLQVGNQDNQVRWMQRVLEGPHSCGLCIVASTQNYHNRPVLLPIHPGCDCSVRYAYGDRYPAQIHDPTLLADVHDRIEARFGASSSAARVIPGARDARQKLIRYRDVLVDHEHGELGPILAVRGAAFLGPDDL